ncbi:MAG: SRPBCC family protein, partial [Flavipsychrobacter sp.]
MHYEPIIYTIDIPASTATVWKALTDPAQLQQWMTEDKLDIATTWQPGTPIIIRGTSHDHSFENKGTIVQYQPEAV